MGGLLKFFELDPKLLAFAAVGAFAHWLLLRSEGTIPAKITNFVGDLMSSGRWRLILSIGIFVGLGAFFGVMMIAPVTNRQAFAAGLAWTTMLSGITSETRKAGNEQKA